MACFRDAVIWKSYGGSEIVQRMNPFDATRRDLRVGEYEWGTRVAWLQARLHTVQCCHVRFITDRAPLSTQKVTNRATFSWALSVEVEWRPDRKSNTSSTQHYVYSFCRLAETPSRRSSRAASWSGETLAGDPQSRRLRSSWGTWMGKGDKRGRCLWTCLAQSLGGHLH